MAMFILPRDKEECLKFLDEILEENKMIKTSEAAEGSINNPLIYYFRDKENRPIVTIAIAKRMISRGSGGLATVHFRGISICSPRDRPDKTVGKNIAIGRLKSANLHCRTELPIKRELTKLLTYSPIDGYEFSYKSAADVTLTKYEKKLFRDLSKRIENHVMKGK